MPVTPTPSDQLSTLAGSADGARGPSGRGLLKERAYAELREHILNGTFAPGTFLSERQLAVDLAMSKTPIRAAVERLELEGFLTISPQQGIIVRDMSVHEIADQYEIRVALETFVLRHLAGRLTPYQVERVEDNLRAQEQNCQRPDIGKCVELDAEFHILFCTFLGNQEMLRVMGHLRDKMYRVIFRVFKKNAGRILGSYDEHRAIADAVIQGDASLAARRLEDHLECGKQSLLSRRE